MTDNIQRPWTKPKTFEERASTIGDAANNLIRLTMDNRGLQREVISFVAPLLELEQELAERAREAGEYESSVTMLYDDLDRLNFALESLEAHRAKGDLGQQDKKTKRRVSDSGHRMIDLALHDDWPMTPRRP